MARRRLGAEDPVAPFRYVQIEFQDALLGKTPLDLPRDQRLMGFPQEILLGGEIEVLRELLRDRAATPAQLALLPVACECLLEAFPIKPMVLVERRVFRHDDRLLQMGRDARQRHPGPGQREGPAFLGGLGPPRLDQHGGARIHPGETCDVRQCDEPVRHETSGSQNRDEKQGERVADEARGR